VSVDLLSLSIPKLKRLKFYSYLDNHGHGLPPPHTITQNRRPEKKSFPKTFHSSNSSIDNLIRKIDLKSGKKYLLAFDIDGTLMDTFPNEMMFDIWRESKSPDASIKTLSNINSLNHPQLRSVCLTARCNDDFLLVPVFDDMPVYGNFGYLKTHPNSSYKEFHKDRSEILGDLLDNLFNHMALIHALHKFGIQQNTDIVYDPNSFYLKLRNHNIEKKDNIIKITLGFLNHGGEENWTSDESPDGTLIIFSNSSKPFDKAQGIKHLISRENIDKDTTLVIFGDSGTDLLAMNEAKKKLGRNRVINVAVGSKLANEGAVDIVFRDFIDTRKFIGRLYNKILIHNSKIKNGGH